MTLYQLRNHPNWISTPTPELATLPFGTICLLCHHNKHELITLHGYPTRKEPQKFSRLSGVKAGCFADRYWRKNCKVLILPSFGIKYAEYPVMTYNAFANYADADTWLLNPDQHLMALPDGSIFFLNCRGRTHVCVFNQANTGYAQFIRLDLHMRETHDFTNAAEWPGARIFPLPAFNHTS